MIIDVEKFVQSERPYWEELEQILKRLEVAPDSRMDLAELKRFHYLYERTSADLARLTTFAAEREIRGYLESLVARSYGEIHETRERAHRFAPVRWFFRMFPQTFREHIRASIVSVAMITAGFAFGAFAITFDSESKQVLMPFPQLQIDPHERVLEEGKTDRDRLTGQKASFSSFLMTHNTRVSILTVAMGMTFGVDTIVLLFYNGVILGAVALDYILASETTFLLGWLLPHGAIEIPAIMIAGQAGLVLAKALIGGAKRSSLKMRLRKIAPDLMTLIGGLAILLIWAGLIEAFLSQYHEPVIPYAAKITFGLLELLLLILFLGRSGRTVEPAKS